MHSWHPSIEWQQVLTITGGVIRSWQMMQLKASWMSLTIPKGRGITLLLILNNASNLLWISCRVVSLANSMSLSSLFTDAPVCFLACGGPDVSSDAIAYTFRLFCLQNCNPVHYDRNQMSLITIYKNKTQTHLIVTSRMSYLPLVP